MKLRNRLVDKLKDQSQWPLVTLEEFFVGNDDEASIGCNLERHPGIPFFFETLKEVRARPDVQEVLIEITDLNQHDENLWPFTDSVYIVADATECEVCTWLKDLHPDEAPAGDPDKRIASTLKLRRNMEVFIAWWD